MSTLAQTSSGDIDISVGKTAQLVTDSAQSAANILFHKFRRFLGEWFLDTREGIDYFGAILVKNPDLGHIRQIFRQVILSTAPIVSTTLDLKLDSATRVLTFSFVATTDSGATIMGGSGVPFIVEKQ